MLGSGHAVPLPHVEVDAVAREEEAREEEPAEERIVDTTELLHTCEQQARLTRVSSRPACALLVWG
jgi:hypothetical protein